MIGRVDAGDHWTAIAILLAGCVTLDVGWAASPVLLASVAGLGWRMARTWGWAAGRPLIRVPGPGPEDGSWHMGTAADGEGQAWLSDRDVAGNLLMISGLGTEVEEAVGGVLSQAVARGAGVILVSGRSLRSDVATTSVATAVCGRRDDLLVLDWCEPRHGPILGAPHRWDPFAVGDGPRLARIVGDMVDPDGHAPGPRRLVEAVVRVLVHDRDVLGRRVTLTGIADAMARPAFEGLAERALATMPPDVHGPLHEYVASLATHPQGAEAGAALDSWSVGRLLRDVAGLIREAGGTGTDVDLADVIVNRRVLLVALPDFGIAAGVRQAAVALVVGGLDVALSIVGSDAGHRRGTVSTVVAVDVRGDGLPSRMAEVMRRANGHGAAFLHVLRNEVDVEGFARAWPDAVADSPFGTCCLMRIAGTGDMGPVDAHGVPTCLRRILDLPAGASSEDFPIKSGRTVTLVDGKVVRYRARTFDGHDVPDWHDVDVSSDDLVTTSRDGREGGRDHAR